MKAKLIPVVLVAAAICPVLAHASLIGDFQGTFQQTSGNPNSGTLDFDFLTSTPDGSVFDLTGTAGITGSACTQSNCGFEPAFTGTFNPTTGAVAFALQPTPTSGNSVIDVSGMLSTDMTVISGTYEASDLSAGGVFSVTAVPLPAAGGLFGLGVAMLGVLRRRRTTAPACA